MTTSDRPIEVSVIICVRNGATTIRRQLDALDRQERHPPFELLIVDNGSRDATRRVVEEWIAAGDHPAQYVTLIDGPKRAGIPRTRNTGAKHATGRILAFCDADDEVASGWVAAHAQAVDADQLSGGRILARSVDGHDLAQTFGAGLFATRYLPHVGGANWAVAKTTYMDVGGFDESLPRYGFDDVDFSWRVQEAGYPIKYTESASVHFTVSNGRTSVRKRFALGTGRVLMAARYPQYDPRRYAFPVVVREFVQAAGMLIGDTLRSRRVNRSQAGQVFALSGRVWGTIKYRGGRRLPERRLLATTAVTR